MTLKLDRLVTGEEIRRAVEVVAGRDFHQEISKVVDDTIFYHIGRMTKYPYDSVAVATGDSHDEMHISLDEVYQEISVISFFAWREQKPVFVIGHHDVSIIGSTRSFRDQLQIELNKLFN